FGTGAFGHKPGRKMKADIEHALARRMASGGHEPVLPDKRLPGAHEGQAPHDIKPIAATIGSAVHLERVFAPYKVYPGLRTCRPQPVREHAAPTDDRARKVIDAGRRMGRRMTKQ